MITIIEGVDGTGKTTYAKYLANKTRATYLHADKPIHKTYYQEYILPLTHPNMVLDRWHVGEIVWPKVYNRKSLFDDESFDICNWKLAKLNTKLIILTRSNKEIAKELTSRGEINDIESVLYAKDLFIEAYKKVKYIDKQIIESGVIYVHNN